MTVNRYWLYLERLRRSGVTNMYGAAPNLADEFGLSKSDAQNILVKWMRNYDPEDYKEMGEE